MIGGIGETYARCTGEEHLRVRSGNVGITSRRITINKLLGTDMKTTRVWLNDTSKYISTGIDTGGYAHGEVTLHDGNDTVEIYFDLDSASDRRKSLKTLDKMLSTLESLHESITDMEGK